MALRARPLSYAGRRHSTWEAKLRMPLQATAFAETTIQRGKCVTLTQVLPHRISTSCLPSDFALRPSVGRENINKPPVDIAKEAMATRNSRGALFTKFVVHKAPSTVPAKFRSSG